jgi:hypothetical protein
MLSVTFLIQNLLILYLILVIELQNQITIVVVRTRSLIYSMTFVVVVQSSWWGVPDTILCDKVCQWLARGRWLFPDTPGFPPIKHWPPRYNWNIVVSGIKHHNSVVQSCWRLIRCSCDVFNYVGQQHMCWRNAIKQLHSTKRHKRCHCWSKNCLPSQSTWVRFRILMELLMINVFLCLCSVL